MAEEESGSETPDEEDWGRAIYTASGSRLWSGRAMSCSEIPVRPRPETAATIEKKRPQESLPRRSPRRRSLSLLVRTTSLGHIPKPKESVDHKKRLKKAGFLTQIKPKEWRLKNLKHKVTDETDTAIADRYLSWKRAYRSGSKIGFCKVHTNIETEDKDPRKWKWCVWNTRTGRLAFGNDSTPSMILEIRLVKVVVN